MSSDHTPKNSGPKPTLMVKIAQDHPKVGANWNF